MHTLTYMPWVALEPTIQAFERSKIVHASNRGATVIGYVLNSSPARIVRYTASYFKFSKIRRLSPPKNRSWHPAGTHTLINHALRAITQPNWATAISLAKQWQTDNAVYKNSCLKNVNCALEANSEVVQKVTEQICRMWLSEQRMLRQSYNQHH
jgi:hypothetical protein